MARGKYKKCVVKTKPKSSRKYDCDESFPNERFQESGPKKKGRPRSCQKQNVSCSAPGILVEESFPNERFQESGPKKKGRPRSCQKQNVSCSAPGILVEENVPKKRGRPRSCQTQSVLGSATTIVLQENNAEVRRGRKRKNESGNICGANQDSTEDVITKKSARPQRINKRKQKQTEVQYVNCDLISEEDHWQENIETSGSAENDGLTEDLIMDPLNSSQNIKECEIPKEKKYEIKEEEVEIIDNDIQNSFENEEPTVNSYLNWPQVIVLCNNEKPISTPSAAIGNINVEIDDFAVNENLSTSEAGKHSLPDGVLMSSSDVFCNSNGPFEDSTDHGNLGMFDVTEGGLLAGGLLNYEEPISTSSDDFCHSNRPFEDAADHGDTETFEVTKGGLLVPVLCNNGKQIATSSANNCNINVDFEDEYLSTSEAGENTVPILLNGDCNTDRINEVNNGVTEKIASDSYIDEDNRQTNIEFSHMYSMISNLDTMSYDNILKVVKTIFKNKLHSTAPRVLEDSIFESIYTDVLLNSGSDMNKFENLKKLAYCITLFVKIRKKDPSIISLGSCFNPAKLYVLLDTIKEMCANFEQVEFFGSLVEALSWFFNSAGVKITEEAICKSQHEEEKDAKIRDINIVLEVINSNWENVYLITNNRVKKLTSTSVDTEFITSDDVTPSLGNMKFISASGNTNRENYSLENNTPTVLSSMVDQDKVSAKKKQNNKNVVHKDVFKTTQNKDLRRKSFRKACCKLSDSLRHPCNNNEDRRSVTFSESVLTENPIENNEDRDKVSMNLESNKQHSSNYSLISLSSLISSTKKVTNDPSIIDGKYQNENGKTVQEKDTNTENSISSGENPVNLQQTQKQKPIKKKHYCFYCKTIVTNISRHLVTVHKNEKEVVQLKKLSNKNSKDAEKERKGILAEIRLRGNHVYTQKLLAESSLQGSAQPTSILFRNCSKFTSGPKRLQDIVMCTFCRGVYGKRTFCRHIKRCYSKKKHDLQNQQNNPDPYSTLRQSCQKSQLTKSNLIKAKNYCLFCYKIVPKFTQHVLAKHKDKNLVIQYMALLKEKSEHSKRKRMKILRLLQIKSNNAYIRNCVQNISSMKTTEKFTTQRCPKLSKTPQKRYKENVPEARKYIRKCVNKRLSESGKPFNCNVHINSGSHEITSNVSKNVNTKMLRVRKYGSPLCKSPIPFPQASTQLQELVFPQIVNNNHLLQNNEGSRSVILRETVLKDKQDVNCSYLNDWESKDSSNSLNICSVEEMSSNISFVDKKYENEVIIQKNHKYDKQHFNNTSSGKNPYSLSRRNYCMFCKTIVNNFTRHILEKHRNNKTVIQYKAISKNKINKKERLIFFNKLKLKSNYIYKKEISNNSVLRNSNVKNLMMVKEYSKKGPYFTCKACKGVYIKGSLNKHECNEPVKDTNKDDNSNEEYALDLSKCNKNKCFGIELEINEEHSLATDDNITRMLQNNSGTQMALNDALFMSVVRSHQRKHQKKRSQTFERYTFKKIKLGCNFLLKLKEKDCSIHQLSDCLVPSKRDIVSETIKDMCKFNESTGKIGITSMPSRLLMFMRDATSQALKDVVLNQLTNNERRSEIMQGADGILSVLQKMTLLSKLQKEKVENPPSKDTSSIDVKEDTASVIENISPAFIETDGQTQCEISVTEDNFTTEDNSPNVNLQTLHQSSIPTSLGAKITSFKNSTIFVSEDLTVKPLSKTMDSSEEPLNCGISLSTEDNLGKIIPPNEDNTMKTVDKLNSTSFEQETASENKCILLGGTKAVQLSTEHYLSGTHNKNSNLHKIISRKRDYCIYCKKWVTHLSRHLKTLHKNEKEVIQINELSKINSRDALEEKKGLLKELRFRGNHVYTQQLLADSSVQSPGNLTSFFFRNCSKSNSGPKRLQDIVMCTFCKGVYGKRTFCRHIKRCYSKKKHDLQNQQNNPDPYNTLNENCKKSQLTKANLIRAKNYCLFCHKIVPKFIQHVLGRHKDTEPVIQYTALIKENSEDSKSKRRDILRLLQLRNIKAYSRNSAQNIKSMKISEKFTPQRCPKFSKTLQKRNNEDVPEVSGNLKQCENERLSESEKTSNCNDSHAFITNTSKKLNTRIWPVRKYASPLIPSPSIISLPQASPKLRELVFPRLKIDHASRIALNDTLLVATASRALERMYTKSKDNGFNSATHLIRVGGKLLICAQSLDKTITEFRDLLKASKVDTVFEAAKEMCGLDEKTGSVKFVNMPFRITYVINQAAAQTLEEALNNTSLNENDKKSTKDDIDEFLELKRTKFRSIITRWPASKIPRKTSTSDESDEESNDEYFTVNSTRAERSSAINKSAKRCGSGVRDTKKRKIYSSSESEENSFDESDRYDNPILKPRNEGRKAHRKNLTSDNCYNDSLPKEAFFISQKKRWTEKQKRIVILEFKDFIINGTNPGRRRCRELIASSEELNGRTADQVNLIIDNINKGKLKMPAEFEYLKSRHT